MSTARVIRFLFPASKEEHQDGVALRRALQHELDHSPQSRHPYVVMVREMNHELETAGVPISASMHDSVRTSLADIHAGYGSLPVFHAREALTLARDAVHHVVHGDMSLARVNAAGAILNAAAVWVAGAVEHRKYKVR